MQSFKVRGTFTLLKTFQPVNAIYHKQLLSHRKQFAKAQKGGGYTYYVKNICRGRGDKYFEIYMGGGDIYFEIFLKGGQV